MSSRSAQGLDVLKRLAKDKRCMLSFRGIGGIGLHGQVGVLGHALWNADEAKCAAYEFRGLCCDSAVSDGVS